MVTVDENISGIVKEWNEGEGQGEGGSYQRSPTSFSTPSMTSLINKESIYNSMIATASLKMAMEAIRRQKVIVSFELSRFSPSLSSLAFLTAMRSLVALLIVVIALVASAHVFKPKQMVPLYSNKVGPYENPDETYPYHEQTVFCQARFLPFLTLALALLHRDVSRVLTFPPPPPSLFSSLSIPSSEHSIS